MMIDDDTLKQLLRINDELLQLCKFLNEKRDMETSSRLIPKRLARRISKCPDLDDSVRCLSQITVNV
jgi:hypothetical protein